MVRTQIQLTEEQIEALRRLAASEGRSLADLIRQSVELYLTRGGRDAAQMRIERARKAAGKFASGSRDVSTKHDKYLAEAYRG
jgi:Arc/MetJ-type ribon-helix-helix transcriptional regulator